MNYEHRNNALISQTNDTERQWIWGKFNTGKITIKYFLNHKKL